jgi:hypothetical protein
MAQKETLWLRQEMGCLSHEMPWLRHARDMIVCTNMLILTGQFPRTASFFHLLTLQTENITNIFTSVCEAAGPMLDLM